MDLTRFMHGGPARLLTCPTCGLMIRDEAVPAHYANDVYDSALLKHLYPRYVRACEDKRLRYMPALRKKPEAIFIWNCFEQLEDPSHTLRESYRRLDKHGMLLVRVPNADFYREQRWRLRNLRSHAALKLLGYSNLLGFPCLHGYTPATLDRLLRAHHFDPVAAHNSSVIEPPYPQMSQRMRDEWRATRYDGERSQSTGGPWIEVLCRKRLS